MFYTIYKVTNKINGKTYIGSHKTRNLDDRYMGSGKYLKRSIEKYGLENFQKDILHVFETSEEMYAKESELVNEDFLADENTYNLKVGGFGGFDYLNKNMRMKISSLSSEYMKKRYKKDNHFKQIRKDVAKRINLSALGVEAFKNHPSRKGHAPFRGRKHTKKSKMKIGKANSIRLQGKNNPQFGKMWITNGVENTRIPNTSKIPDGWRKGRLMDANSKSRETSLSS